MHANVRPWSLMAAPTWLRHPEFDLDHQARLTTKNLGQPHFDRFFSEPHPSFFAFTTTPKLKSKAVFDEPGPSGASPFHEYAMRQAIEESFIMDVLQNHTTYKRFFGLIKQVEDDPDVPRRCFTRCMEFHPVKIEQVVFVMSSISGTT